MNQPDVKLVSSATGTFTALQSPTRQNAVGGNREPAAGNDVPVEEQATPEIEMLVQQLNLTARSIGRELRFEVDMESGRSVIQVLDRETGEVIRQIPEDKTGIFLSRGGDVRLRLYDATV